MKKKTTSYPLTPGGKIIWGIWALGTLLLLLAEFSFGTVLVSLFMLFIMSALASGFAKDAAEKREKLWRQMLALDPIKQPLYENLTKGTPIVSEFLDRWKQRDVKDRMILASVAFEEAMDAAKDNPEGLLTIDQVIDDYIEVLELPLGTIYPLAKYKKFIHLLALYDLQDGRLPRRVESRRGLSELNLQKGEEFLWSFPQVEYSEERIEREYHRGSRGTSVRIAKGITVHSGHSNGKVVSKSVMKVLARGTVLVTTKSFYFLSDAKTMRVPHDKVLSYVSRDTGLVVKKDGKSPKPMYFMGLDGTFFCALIRQIPIYLDAKG